MHIYFNHLKKLQLHRKQKQTSIQIKKISVNSHFILMLLDLFFNYKATTAVWQIIVHSYLVIKKILISLFV